MSAHLRKGEHVSWAWAPIAQVFAGRVKRAIKGKAVVRNASAEEPAYLVRQADGSRALESGSGSART